MANVLILGGGFAGLMAAEKLAAALPAAGHQITVISRNRNFIFYPALVQVAFNKFKPENVTFNLQSKLSSIGVRFVHGEVMGINEELHHVKVAGDDFTGDINYDFLIVALGRRLATEKTPGFFEYSNHLLTVEAAQKFSQRIQSFEAGKIVVGMCPGASLPVPVCETAFALARKFEHQIKEEKISVSVVFPETMDEAFGGANLHRDLERAFEKYRINYVTNFSVKEIAEKQILSDAQAINYDLLMMLPPFQGQVVVKLLGEESSDAGGYARVNDFMQIHGKERMYAIGDITALPGPKLGQMAVQQAKVAAANVFAEITGAAPDASYYHEIAAIIDQGGADSIYLHYGIWDETLYRLQTGTLWSWIKSLHDKYWRAIHLK